MTMWDFFYQAGFWQWAAFIILASVIGCYLAKAIIGFTPFAKSKTINHYYTSEEGSTDWLPTNTTD